MKLSNDNSNSNNKEEIESNIEKIRVLHVDDEEDFLELTKIYLEKISNQSLHVDSTSSPEQVIDYLKDHDYDVLVSDYQMPELDGLELLEQLRNQNNDIPFIIFTGKGREEIAVQALNLGVDSYVIKGPDSRSLYAELAHIIARLAKEKHLEKELYESQQHVRDAKKKIENLYNTLTTIRKINQLITKENDRDILIQEICECFVKNRGFYSAWIALFNEKREFLTHSVSGIGNDFQPILECLQKGKLFEGCEEAYSHEKTSSIMDVTIKCPSCPLVHKYRERASMVAVLENEGKKFGILTISLSVEYLEETEEIILLKEAVDDIAFGLHKIEKQELAKAAEEEIEKKAYELGERVKELTGLFEFSKIIAYSSNLESTFMNLLELIPTAWQYPEITMARINFREDVFTTPDFVLTDWKLSSEIVIEGEKVGQIEVYYREKMPEMDEGPFQKEERHLIDTLARLISQHALRLEGLEDIKEIADILFTVFNNSPIGTATYASTGECLSTNEIHAEMVGASVEQILDQNFNEIDAWKKSGLLLAAKQALSNLETVRFEILFENSFGKEVWLDYNLVPITSKSGNLLLVFIVDINERKTEEMKYRTLFNQTSDLIFLLHIEKDYSSAKIVEVNESACNKLGYTRNEILNMTIYDLDPKMNVETIMSIGQIVKETEQLSMESVLKAKDGSLIPIEVKSIFYNIGDEMFLQSAARDITEKKQAEDYLRQQKEETELYLDIITHDLSNSFVIANGFLDIALESELLGEAKDSIEKSRSSLFRCENLLNNVSTLLKLKESKEYDYQPINFEKTILKTETQVKELYPEKKIEIKRINFNLNFMLKADLLFEQLMINLLSNAVKSDAREIVRIEIQLEECAEGECIISISDYGCGIPEEERESIFARYSEFRKRGEGSGLGLFIVKNIIDRYNGKIWLENRIKEDFTQGTVFKIKLSEWKKKEQKK